MKLSLFNLVVAVCALSLSACQSSEKPETAVFRDFNLGAAVEQMNVAQLQPMTHRNNLPTTINFKSERLRSFEVKYLIDEQSSEPFDEISFLNELKTQITEQISEAGVRNFAVRVGDVIYINYLTKENRGSFEVIGARVEGNKYKLW
ncbi:MAG TPA: hypothetical protein VK308_14875, partial [Pyrinomonadaceae bacterium]|nr:hypothetical protein [Pyrinomonadaceae bacterium]